MSVRIKIDEDLPTDVAELIRQAGLDVQTVSDEGLGGAKDTDLWAAVQRERRCLITADKGFADIQVYPPGHHHGIILLRVPRESRAAYVAITKTLLDKLDLREAVGSIVVVAPTSIRIRRG